MKKIILSFFVLLLSLSSLLALEPVTETYTHGYKSPDTDANAGKNYDWSALYPSPVTITWSAEPLSEMGSDGFPHYKVTVTMENTQSTVYYNWTLGLVKVDDFVACDTPPELQKFVFVNLQNDFGVSPAGTSKLVLNKNSTFYYLSTSSVSGGSETIEYEAEITNGSTVITPPDQIIFGASYLEENSIKGLVFTIQRDHPDQPTVVTAQ
ncbi:MAG: hypothetical protein K2W99_06370 [Chthoniobacterales bacterium]|nr:hypothetical protein [Chthoniobacterales bacterium]